MLFSSTSTANGDCGRASIILASKDKHQVRVHSLRTNALGDVFVRVFQFEDEFSHTHPVVALTVGNNFDRMVPLVRVHSRCLYGEVFGSLDCDCLPQLQLTWQAFIHEKSGILIYLEQEGRGCGLISKATAYEMRQEEGLDTVEAYRRLGLPLDARQYSTAAVILKELGLDNVRLLTNNPAKISGLVAAGIGVQPVHLRSEPTKWNHDYLVVKQVKLGHDLGFGADQSSGQWEDWRGRGGPWKDPRNVVVRPREQFEGDWRGLGGIPQ